MSLLAQDEHLTRKVGAISLALIALAIGFIVFVYDRIDWGRHVHVRVYFHTAGGLLEGAQFVVAGRDVGRVDAIALSPHGAPGPLAGDEGVVVTVAIERSAIDELHVGDVFVAARGPLAGKYLELGPADEGAAPLREGSELLGRDPPSLDRVIEHTWDNLMTVSKFADDVKPELDALRAQITELRAHLDPAGTDLAMMVPAIDRMGALIDDASTVSDQVRQLRDTGLGGDAGLAHLSEVIGRSRAMVAQTRGALDKLSASVAGLRASWAAHGAQLTDRADEVIAKVESAIDRIRAAADKLDPLLAQIDALNTSLARGEGSLMKLMHDPEFPEDAKELGKILKRQPWKVIDHPK